MTVQRGVPTRFGMLYWRDSTALPGWLNLAEQRPHTNSHAAAIRPDEGRVVVYIPQDDWPGGYDVSLNETIPGATLEQLIDIATLELIRIGTIDPLAWVTRCEG